MQALIRALGKLLEQEIVSYNSREDLSLEVRGNKCGAEKEHGGSQRREQ